MTHHTDAERAEPIKMQAGDDLHLTMLMASHGLNFVTGKDREQLLAWGRDVWQAARSAPAVPVPQGWLSEVQGFLTAAADGSMSRNNQEQLAAELLQQLAAAPQPPEAAPHIGDCENKVCTGCMPSMPPVTPEEFSRDIAEMVAAPVKLPEPAIPGSQGVCCGNFTTGGYYMGQHEQVCCGCPDDAHPPYYTEQQVRDLLAAHGIGKDKA